MEINQIDFLELPMGTWDIISLGLSSPGMYPWNSMWWKSFYLVLELVFSQLSSRAKYFFDRVNWTSNLNIDSFFLFLESVSVSPTIVRLILTIWENNPYSIPIFWIDVLISTGMKWETLNSCLNFNGNYLGKLTTDCLNYSSSMTSKIVFQGLFRLNFFWDLPALYLAHLRQKYSFKSCLFFIVAFHRYFSFLKYHSIDRFHHWVTHPMIIL